MKLTITAALLLATGTPALAQQAPTATPPGVPAPAPSDTQLGTAPEAPAPTASPDSTLTEAEQKTLARCAAMSPVQQAQSSKCSKVMVKAGKGDPAHNRGPKPGANELH